MQVIEEIRELVGELEWVQQRLGEEEVRPLPEIPTMHSEEMPEKYADTPIRYCFRVNIEKAYMYVASFSCYLHKVWFSYTVKSQPFSHDLCHLLALQVRVKAKLPCTKTAMLYRRYEYTRETLLRFKEEMALQKERAAKGLSTSDSGGAFGGFGATGAAPVETKVSSNLYCMQWRH